MQDTINEKTLNLCVRIGRVSADELKKAADKLLIELEKTAQGSLNSLNKSDIRHGKQTLKQLDRHNAGRSSIELADPNLRLLKREMDKKGVDFAIQKDKAGKYLLFFKSNDADAMTAALRGYSRKMVKQSQRPSITSTLAAMKEAAAKLNIGRDTVKNKDKGAR